MKSDILHFLLLKEPNTFIVVLGCCIICLSAAITGCFAFLRKRALVGDAISHSVLPGICIAFMISGEKDSLGFLTGAIVSGMISNLAMEWLIKKNLLRTDTAITLMLSVFFGTGIVFLTYIQHQGNAAQAGLDKYLFGKAASLTMEDLKVIAFSGIIMLIAQLLLFRGLSVLSFDSGFAETSGFPVSFLRFTLSLLTVWTIAVGIQATGIVLMSSLLIAPALASRFWTNSLQKMVMISALFGLISGYSGAMVSYMAPAMPTGPWIVVVLTFITFVSMLFAPAKGILSRWRVHQNNKNKILEENILKLLFRISENNKGRHIAQSTGDMLQYRTFEISELKKGLAILLRKELINEISGNYLLTESGIEQGRKIIRHHRLWELYLQKKLHLPPDHVHEDAEAVEHVITPEIEKMLDQELGFPKKDPHKTQIPQVKS